MTIGILECGVPPDPLRQRTGGYGAIVQDMFGPGQTCTIFNAAAGELPASETVCQAFVITGSPAGVYDPLPWIAPLLGFLRQARGKALLVGICFGHQAMAEAFGGKVEKSAKGWGVGLHRYTIAQRSPWMDGADQVAITAMHQDQVIRPPDDARITAASDFTPYAGLDYGDAMSFQFHPEFSPDFARALIESRRDRLGELAGPALASYAQPDDRARVIGWISRFLGETAAQTGAP